MAPRDSIIDGMARGTPVRGEVIKRTPEAYARPMKEALARWVRIRKETGIRVE